MISAVCEECELAPNGFQKLPSWVHYYQAKDIMPLFFSCEKKWKIPPTVWGGLRASTIRILKKKFIFDSSKKHNQQTMILNTVNDKTNDDGTIHWQPLFATVNITRLRTYSRVKLCCGGHKSPTQLAQEGSSRPESPSRREGTFLKWNDPSGQPSPVKHRMYK